MLVRVVEVGGAVLADDARLRLDRDLGALARRELQRLGEAALGAVGGLAAVDVGVVEEVDARVTCGAHEFADLVVGLVGDPHDAEDDVGNLEVGGSEGGDGLHIVHARTARLRSPIVVIHVIEKHNR